MLYSRKNNSLTLTVHDGYTYPQEAEIWETAAAISDNFEAFVRSFAEYEYISLVFEYECKINVIPINSYSNTNTQRVFDYSNTNAEYKYSKPAP